MLRREFGHTSQNHVPVQGYQQCSNLQFSPGCEGFTAPARPLSARQLRRAGLLPEVPADMSEFEDEFGRYDEILGDTHLPVSEYRDEIKTAVRDNQTTILVGETGSGKSTVTPLMLLEDGHEVVMTQPRRIAARFVAERMQNVLHETLGAGQAEGVVGHRTATSSDIKPNTRVSVITDGIAVRRLADREQASRAVDIFDEVHERNTNIDVAMGLAKERLQRDPNARLLLMSATMDAPRIAGFFADVTTTPPVIIEVPGRSYPIEKVHEPESTVLDQIIKSAVQDKPRTILVFLPGKEEIADTASLLRRGLPAELKKEATILPLHAQLKRADQDKVKEPVEGLKIILATEMAQTSLTLDGVDVVVDSGLHRRIELTPDGTEILKLHPVSQAECDQRAGRTGRLGPGKYILTRLNRRSGFVPYEARDKYPTPEILRTTLDRVALQLAADGRDIDTFEFPQQIDRRAAERAKRSLYDLGALDENGGITPLGKRMNEFPLKPSSARMLVEALPFSTHIQAQLAAIAASLEVGGLISFAREAGEDWQDLTDEHTSDLIAQLEIFIASQNMTDEQLEEHDLNVPNVRQAQELYGRLIRKTQAWQGELWSPTQGEREALKQAIYAGLVNQVYQHAGEGYERMGGTADGITRELGNRTVLTGKPRLVVATPRGIEFVYKGEPTEKQIIENVTELDDPRILGRVAAAHLLSWEPIRKVWRGGVLKEVQQLVFHNCVALGETREVDAPPTPENRTFVADSLLQTAGPAQQKLRAIKKELEELQRMTPSRIPTLTQDTLLGLLKEAMADSDLDQSRIDNNLRVIMAERGISLDEIISPEERTRIRRNSPSELTVGPLKFKLDYHAGTPVVMNVSAAMVQRCPDELALPDGRELMFWQGRRRLTLTEVRAELDSLLQSL